MATLTDARQLSLVRPMAGVRAVRGLKESKLAQVAMIMLVSTFIGGVFALTMLSNGQWRQSLAEWWAWGLITPFIIAADRRLPLDARQFTRRAQAHIALCMVFTAIYLYVFFAIRALMNNLPWSHLAPAQMFTVNNLGWFMWSCLIYGMIVGALQAYRYYEHFVNSELKAERLEKSYSQARLNALRMQLDPHFLFNALNTISSHVERDPRLTRRMIEHLGDLLRMSLESKDRQEVPLAEELAFLDHYLEIQKIRFGDQLQVEMEIAPEVRYASVPSLFLQPLVENAIRHGISRRISGGTVMVTAKPVDGHLAIDVEDDGVGLPHAWTLDSGAGLGLSVTRERIAGLYPDGMGGLTVRRRPEGGTAVEVRLPLRVMGDDNGRG